ncbi:MAG: hypothetical protein EBV77_04470 [Gemmatimonadaceae bacterium]|nr:hypothetical protein [Gemmatimonadaceae bacterium]
MTEKEYRKVVGALYASNDQNAHVAARQLDLMLCRAMPEVASLIAVKKDFTVMPERAAASLIMPNAPWISVSEVLPRSRIDLSMKEAASVASMPMLLDAMMAVSVTSMNACWSLAARPASAPNSL